MADDNEKAEDRRIVELLIEIRSEYRSIMSFMIDLWRKIQDKDTQRSIMHLKLSQHSETLDRIEKRFDILFEIMLKKQGGVPDVRSDLSAPKDHDREIHDR